MRRLDNKRISRFSKIIMILLILSPILQCYGWGKYDFSFIIMSILSPIYLLTHDLNKERLPKRLLLYWGWWYLSHALSSNSISEMLHLGILRIVLTYIMFIDVIDLKYFMSQYKKISLIIIGYFYIQEFCRIILGFHLLSVATFLPLAVTDNAQEYYNYLYETERSSSFFKEPAVFAQFLLPLLCFELFGKENKNIKYLLLLTITLLCSRTGNAIAGLTAVGVCYFIYLLKNKNWSIIFRYILLLSLAIVVTMSVYVKSNEGQKIIEKASTLDVKSTIGKGYVGSSFWRLYQGNFIFNEYSPVYKLLGNDHEDYIRQRATQSSVIKELYSNKEFVIYFNSFYSVLIYTGFIGFLLIFFFLKDIWKKNSYCGKSILFLLVVISFISCNFFTTTMAFYLIPAIALKKNTSVS